ncbi:unnamed protein product [Urochloa humidicola]
MDWAGLPADLLVEFAVRLTVTDFLRFRAVEPSGRDGPVQRTPAKVRASVAHAGRERRPGHRRLLLLTGRPLPYSSLARPRDPAAHMDRLRRRLGRDRRRRVRAAPAQPRHRRSAPAAVHHHYGLLPAAAADRERRRHRVPVRRELVPGSAAHWPEKASEDRRPYDKIPIDRMPLRFLRKAVPVRDPSSGEYLVVMIHGPMFKLVFARRRDARWVVLPSPYLFEDVVLHEGRLCSMTACGALLVWEPDGETFKSRVAVPEHNEGEEYVYFRKYLAESLDGDLVLIWRERRSCYGGDGV